MITYEDIYEAARKERYSEQIQPVSKNFVEEVAKYLKEKKEIVAKDNSGFSDLSLKTQKQLENSITLFKELLLRRRKKILNLVLIAAEIGISKQDFENMLSFEKSLFEDLMKCVDSSEKSLNEILSGKKEETKNNDLVVFIDDVDSFVDMLGEKMGPFNAGQIANIPKEIAKILIEAKKVELLEE